MIRTLVLDASSTITGFCIVDHDPAQEIAPGFPGAKITDGIIDAGKGTLVDRLMNLGADIRTLITEYKCNELCIEDVTFKQKSGLTNKAMAAVDFKCREIAKEFNIPFYTQNNQTIKSMMTGTGSATKEQMIKAVCWMFRLIRSYIKDDNHADAIAGAFVWLQRRKQVLAEIEREKLAKAERRKAKKKK